MRNKLDKKLLTKLFLAPFFMFGFSYAMVPIYNVLCEITGFNGTTGRVDSENNYVVDDKRSVNISFFAETANEFPVQFYPKQKTMDITPGKFYTATYVAKNNSNNTIVGQAVPSVAPTDAALHFKKLECFCFSRQAFKPQEEVEMNVRFILEPTMTANIKNISLSYNFFRLDS